MRRVLSLDYAHTSSQSAVIGAAVCFIVFVFILHIFGKVCGMVEG